MGSQGTAQLSQKWEHLNNIIECSLPWGLCSIVTQLPLHALGSADQQLMG
jgi:hypothetical protein